MLIKSQRLKKAVSAVLVTTIIVMMLPGTTNAGPDDIVNIPDSILKSTLLAIPGADSNSDSQLSVSELAALPGSLDLHSKKINDITGLEYATGITNLNLSDNTIRDISCMSLNIGKLSLSSLDVSENYLNVSDGSDDKTNIDAIAAKPCTVTYEPQKSIPANGITLDKTSLEVCESETFPLIATVFPADAANKNVIWTSDNTEIATVVDGAVSILSVGSVNITAATQDGGFKASCVVTIKANNISSSKYILTDSLLKGVSKSTVLPTFKSNLNNAAGDVKVYKADGSELTSGIIGTGMTVKLFVGGKERDSKSIVVNGDTNGDGLVDILDYTSIRLHILNLTGLSNAYFTGGDTDGNGIVDILDYTAIRLDILNLQPIVVTLPNLPEVSDPHIRAFLDKALAQLGKPYVWGTEGPDSFDCSGFVYYCLKQSGYSKTLWRSTADTYSKWPDWQRVDRNELQPGDLMFYWSDTKPGVIGHIGIYLGNGYHIHASSDYGYVVICQVTGWYDKMLDHGMRINF